MVDRQVPQISDLIGLVHKDELAAALGYATANNSFRAWCTAMRILPVPGRAGWYDPRLVRRRLDEAQGLLSEGQGLPATAPLSLVEQRRSRRGAA